MADIVTIRSENIDKYPDNFFTVSVDNDFSPDRTVVVPNTYFPYIVEFTNCPSAQGKRYVSSWIFDKVADAYTRAVGKLLYTMENGLSVFPTITLDYELFRSIVIAERELLTVDAEGKPVTEYKFYGVDIYDFDSLTPEYLLQWLDFPVKDGSGTPIPTMPSLISYYYTPVKDVQVELVRKPNKLDFYENEYIIEIIHNKDLQIPYTTEEEFNLILSKFNFSSGPFSRLVTYQKLKDISTGPKSVADVVNKASTLQKVLTGINQFQSNLTTIQSKLALATFGITFAKKAYKKAIDINKLYIAPLRRGNTKKGILINEVNRLKGIVRDKVASAKTTLSTGAQNLKDKQDALINSFKNINPNTIADQAEKLKSIEGVADKVGKVQSTLSDAPNKLNDVANKISSAPSKVLSLAQENQQKLLKVQADVSSKLDNLKSIDKQVLAQNLVRIIMNTDLTEDVPPLPEEPGPNIQVPEVKLNIELGDGGVDNFLNAKRAEREAELKAALLKDKEEAASLLEKRKLWQSGLSVDEVNAKTSTNNKTSSTSSEEKTKKWQQKLRDAGLYKGEIDGVWGKLTQAAYEAYQKLQTNTGTKTTTGLTPEQLLASYLVGGAPDAAKAKKWLSNIQSWIGQKCRCNDKPKEVTAAYLDGLRKSGGLKDFMSKWYITDWKQFYN